MSGGNGLEPTRVNIGACQCPNSPHAEGDWVLLRPEPSFDMGLAAREAIRQSGWLIGDTDGAYQSVLVRYGVVAWNITGATGDPVRVTTTAVAERLGWSDGAVAVADKARELYEEKVLAPLVPTSSPSAQGTPGENSTSPNPSSGEPSQPSPEPSSPSGSETGT